MRNTTTTITEDSVLQKTSGSNGNGMLQFILQMNTIGLSIIYQEFKTAYFIYDTPNRKNRFGSSRPGVLSNASESLAFIQGTGLEIVLDMYGLMYDATKLRNVFFSMVGDHAKVSD